LPGLDLPYGAFGENFTVRGVTEADVCIGDVFAVGGVLVQVSQPRQPCWKLARRWRVKDLAARVQATGRTGWYFRVLEEGEVTPGLRLVLRERPWPQWTVARANEIMHERRDDRAAALAACPSLSANWRETLHTRAMRGVNPDPARRLVGPNVPVAESA
jgi:MOSC domain-containing protein YiiM